MKKPEKLVLLDVHAILHRAYHALPDFSSSKGESTGGLYGLVSMLLRIVSEIKPDYVVACYDLPEPTFRKQLYDEYKAGRPKADESLVSQIIRSRDVFAAFNIPIYDTPGFEADDIIGTIVEQLKEREDLQVIIASGDMDTLQLVRGDQVVVFTLKKGINDTIVYNESAVVSRFGFGPERLPDYKGLRGDPSDNIIGIAGIGEKTATELITQFGSLEQIYEQLKSDESAFKRAGIKDRVIGLLREGEEEAFFSKTLATIRRDAPIKFVLPGSFRQGVTVAQVEALFAEFEFRTLGQRLRAALADRGVMEVSAPPPLAAAALSAELAIAVWLLDSNLTTPTAEDACRLAGVENLAAAESKIMAEIKEQGLEVVYREIELPLIPIIAAAERRGIVVDVAYLANLSQEYHRLLDLEASKIYLQAGREFNLNSPKQVGEVLFDHLGLSTKGLKKTAGGARSTRESELAKLADEHAIVKNILEYRELAKLVSTYVDSIPTLVDREGRLHTHLHQTGTTTGRMSSSEPNLQNIPAGGERGRAIRRAFKPSDGFVWAGFDYSQIEMRVLALLSRDPELERIFKAGEDIHTGVAARVFKVEAEAVTKDMRRQAKVINFGIIYGMGVNALRVNLGSTRDEAQAFYNNYFETFPTIKNYFEQVKAEALDRGYTETYFGRRRHFPGLKSRLPQVRAMNERMAMNAPLQGTAADIVKKAMIAVEQEIVGQGLASEAFLLLQVHDELIFELKSESVERLVPLIRGAMEGVMGKTGLPFPVSLALGPNWADAK